MVKFYAGVGSRTTPPAIILQMQLLAMTAALHGWTLRSGGAEGADNAFENGASLIPGNVEIFLPWKQFNDNNSEFTSPTPAAIDMAYQIHPGRKNLKQTHLLLHGRNMHQVLGYHLNTPVEFVVCYTADGCERRSEYSGNTGGTGTAILLADRCCIPVFNLSRSGRYKLAINQILNDFT